MKTMLLKRIAARSARVGVIGLGYVGLPLAVRFAQTGFRVTGFDIQAARVAEINAGHSPLLDITHEELADQVGAGRLSAQANFDELAAMDAILVCVPTPLNKTRDPDVSFIVRALDEIQPRLRAGQVVVLESTTWPGFTREVVLPALASTDRVVGRDFFLAFSPERIDPGSIGHGLVETPKVLGGLTPACGEVAAALYGAAIPRVHLVSSTDAAEMAKLLENTFRAVNIGLVNELALMCRKLGLDVWEVIDAAATKPFGFMPFYPGPGLGGHCIPVDPLYLSWKMRSFNYQARFIELADAINSAMPHTVVDLVTDAFNSRRRAINGSAILVLGVAYKRDIDDVRESPAIEIIHLLRDRGAEICYHDPYVPRLSLQRGDLSSVPLDAGLSTCDCALIVTDHQCVDYRRVVSNAPLVVDTRNATAGIPAPAGRVFKL